MPKSNNKAIMKEVSMAAEKAINKISEPKNLLKHAKKLSKEMTQHRRLGKNVESDDAAYTPHKALTSEPYKKQRARDKKNGKLSKFTTADRSNLTRTGELLDNLFGIAKFGRIIIDIAGARNEQLVDHLKKMGRLFFFVGRLERKKLESELRKEIESEINKNL